MMFGTYLDESTCAELMMEASGVGVDFFDLADRYPVPPGPDNFGRTEEIVGRWLKGQRNKFVIATKFGRPVGSGPNDEGGSRKHVIEACEASLRRLQTDRVDLYWMHGPDRSTPIEETLAAMALLREQGKILYLGVSNFSAWQLAEAQVAASQLGLGLISAVQPRYNLLARSAESELLPLCRAMGVGVVPYNPLGGGMLSGKYRRGDRPPRGSRFSDEYFEIDRAHYLVDRAHDIVDALRQAGVEEGMTPAQVAIAWTLGRPGVDATVVGASRAGQITDLARGAESKLSAETISLLDAASSLV